MMINQENKLEETEIYYQDIKCDYDNVESKSRKMEKEIEEMQDKIKYYENENSDLNEKLNNFSELYSNETDQNTALLEEKNKEIELLKAQLSNLEETIEEF